MITRKGFLQSALAGALMLAGAFAFGTAAFLAGALLTLWLLIGRTRLGAARLGVARAQSARDLVEDDVLEVTISVGNLGRVPVWVEFEDLVPTSALLVAGANQGERLVAGRSSHRAQYGARFRLRGEFSTGPLLVRARDPFRSFYAERDWGGSAPVLVYPKSYPLEDLAAASRNVTWLVGQHVVNSPGHGFDFYSLREYQGSDRIRDVNWKASARRGPGTGLVVNQHTRETYAKLHVVLDARERTGVGWEVYSPLAQGARAALTLMRWAHRHRDSFRLFVVGARVHEVRPSGADGTTQDVLARLVQTSAAGDAPMDTLMAPLVHSMTTHAPVVIISPLEDDDSVIQFASTLRARGHHVAVIAPIPCFEVTDGGPGAASPARAATTTIQSLRALGVPVAPWAPDSLLSTVIGTEAIA